MEEVLARLLVPDNEVIKVGQSFKGPALFFFIVDNCMKTPGFQAKMYDKYLYILQTFIIIPVTSPVSDLTISCDLFILPFPRVITHLCMKAATEELRQAFKDPEVIPTLCRILTTSTSPQIRQYAAVLLR